MYNYPINPLSYFLTAKYILNNKDVLNLDCIKNDKIIGKDWYDKCGILEFLFPLSKFLLILENFNRQ